MKTRIRLADKKNCTGCMACIDACPQNAIENYEAADGHIYTKINKDKCVKCGKCEKICQASRYSYGNNILSNSMPYAAWAINEKYRSKGTSGGVFAALAHQVLEQGGVVIGAYMDGKLCRHIIISSIDEIEMLQGSKYLRSETKGIFREIEKHLRDQIVLFCGVGCQVSSVLAYFSNSKYINNLITVDLVCGGVPSSLLVKTFFKQHPEVSAITGFRSKQRYVLTGLINGKNVELDKYALPLKGYSSGFTNRYSCMNCHFAFAHRKSDLTLGDLWGDRKYLKEHRLGVSFVACHSKKGKEILKQSSLFIEPINWEDILPYNSRIIYGKKYIGFLRKYLTTIHQLLSEHLFCDLYSSNYEKLHTIFYLLARYNNFCMNIFKKKGIRKAKSIVKKNL